VTGEVFTAIVGVIGAIVGALIGAVVTAYYSHQQVGLAREQATLAREQATLAREQAEDEREARRRERTALFLTKISVAMQGMAEKLTVKEVPTLEGNTFNNLLVSYEDAVRPYLGEQVREDIDGLKDLASRAIHIDPVLRSDIRYVVEGATTPDPKDLQHSLNELARDLQRKAARALAQATQIETNLLYH